MKKIILIGLLIAIIGGSIGYYMYNKPHKSLTKTAAKYALSANELVEQYGEDEQTSDKLYLDQVIEVEGNIISAAEEGETINVILESHNEMSTVICQMEPGKYSLSDFSSGSNIKIKGMCTGMLMDVVLVHCVIST